MQKRFVAFLIALLVAAGAGVATAQERFGGLTGIVTDATGAVLPGATITITSKNTGASRTIVTSSDGLYNVPDLDPGKYAMVVELSGFAIQRIFIPFYRLSGYIWIEFCVGGHGR